MWFFKYPFFARFQLSHHQNDNDFQWYEYEYFTWSHLRHHYHVSHSHNLHRWKGHIHYLTIHSHWETHWKFQLVHKVIDIFKCIEHTKFSWVLVANHTWFTRFLHKMPQDIRVSFVQAQISQVQNKVGKFININNPPQSLILSLSPPPPHTHWSLIETPYIWPFL